MGKKEKKKKKKLEKYMPTIEDETPSTDNSDAIETADNVEDMKGINSTEIRPVETEGLTVISQFKVTSLQNMAKVEATKAQLSAQVDIFSKKLSAAKKVQTIKIENALFQIVKDLEIERARILQISGVNANDAKIKSLEDAALKLREQIIRIKAKNFNDTMPEVEKRIIDAAYKLFDMLFNEIMTEAGSLLEELEKKDAQNRRIQ